MRSVMLAWPTVILLTILCVLLLAWHLHSEDWLMSVVSLVGLAAMSAAISLKMDA